MRLRVHGFEAGEGLPWPLHGPFKRCHELLHAQPERPAKGPQFYHVNAPLTPFASYCGRQIRRVCYHCCGKDLVNGRGVYCLNVGGTVIEQAVADAFLQAITPAAIEATRLSVEQLQANHDAALSQWRLEVERARYEAERAERRYRATGVQNEEHRDYGTTQVLRP